METNLTKTAGRQEVKVATMTGPAAMKITIEVHGSVSVFNFDNSDPSLIEEISRLIKGFFAILKRRAEMKTT